MATSVTNYTGNVGLGIGSNPQIPITSNEDLAVINNTLRDISIRDADRNMKLYQQKVQERDTLNNLILQNQVSYGKINPEYQKYFDEAGKEVLNAFKEWGGDFNNTEGFRRYQEAVQKHKDVAAQAQMKSAGINNLMVQRSKETNPFRQKDMDAFIDNQKQKGFWDVVDPYQQLFDASFDPIFAFAKPKTRTNIDQNTGLGATQTYYDFNDILNNSRYDFLEGEDGYTNQYTLLNQIQGLNPEELQNFVIRINERLKFNNQLQGLEEGDEGYAPPVSFDVVEGNVVLKDSIPDLMAKVSYSMVDAVGGATPFVDKDLAKMAKDKKDYELDLQRLGIDKRKADAYIKNMNANADKIRNQLKAQSTDVMAQYRKFIDNIVRGGLKIGSRDELKKGGGRYEDIIPLNRLAGGDRFINGVVVNSEGGVTVGELTPFKFKNGEEYYIPRYVNPLTGKQVDFKNLPEEIKQGYEMSNAQSKLRGKGELPFDSYLRGLLLDNALELVVEGKNGAVNYSDMLKSARLINAEKTAKGEEPIIPTYEESYFNPVRN